MPVDGLSAETNGLEGKRDINDSTHEVPIVNMIYIKPIVYVSSGQNRLLENGADD